MNIVEPSYKILSNVDGMELLRQIEYCARTCYQSYNKQTDNSCVNFVKMLIGRNHEACLEHASLSIKFIVDRAIQNEIVRHRIASFCCESTRYCCYAKDKFNNEITVIKPLFFEKDTLEYNLWRQSMETSEKIYLALIAKGCKPEEARSVLPLALKTEIVMTANLREWRHFFKLRTSKRAHPQIREISIPLLNEMKSLLPPIFEDIHVE